MTDASQWSALFKCFQEICSKQELWNRASSNNSLTKAPPWDSWDGCESDSWEASTSSHSDKNSHFHQSRQIHESCEAGSWEINPYASSRTDGSSDFYQHPQTHKRSESDLWGSNPYSSSHTDGGSYFYQNSQMHNRCESDSWTSSTCYYTDVGLHFHQSPQIQERYRIEFDNLPVTIGRERESFNIACLGNGTIVEVLEIAPNLFDGRVRARIKEPAGWISLKSRFCKFAVPESSDSIVPEGSSGFTCAGTGASLIAQSFYPALPQVQLAQGCEQIGNSTIMSEEKTSTALPMHPCLSMPASGGQTGSTRIAQSFYTTSPQTQLSVSDDQGGLPGLLKEKWFSALSSHLSLRGSDRIPRMQRCEHRGRLVELLGICGAVFLDVGTSACDIGRPHWPDPHFERWSALLDEVRASRAWFNARPCVEQRLLRLSGREDLKRTLDGAGKMHTPDQRLMFGFSDRAVQVSWLHWDDLAWVPNHYAQLKNVMVDLVNTELAPLCAAEAGSQGNLGERIWSGCEKWSQSALRHCLYPAGGSCTEHTDYGVLTLQHCTCPGLEVMIDGEWCSVQPPEGSVVLFAGDMLERLTNGKIKALLHRVCMDPPERAPNSATYSCMQRPTARQSHVFFLQPEWSTIVCPLAPFRSGTADDLAPIQYGKWHQQKVSLAFGHSQQPHAQSQTVRPPSRVITPPTRERSRSQRKTSLTTPIDS